MKIFIFRSNHKIQVLIRHQNIIRNFKAEDVCVKDDEITVLKLTPRVRFITKYWKPVVISDFKQLKKRPKILMIPKRLTTTPKFLLSDGVTLKSSSNCQR